MKMFVTGRVSWSLSVQRCMRKCGATAPPAGGAGVGGGNTKTQC